MSNPRYTFEENPTIFGKILRNEIPNKRVYEDDKVLAFHNIVGPQAPIHVMVVHKQHIVGLQDTSEADEKMLGELFSRINTVAKKLGIAESGYRIIVNSGENAGQSIFHLHVHILANAPGSQDHLPGFE